MHILILYNTLHVGQLFLCLAQISAQLAVVFLQGNHFLLKVQRGQLFSGLFQDFIRFPRVIRGDADVIIPQTWITESSPCRTIFSTEWYGRWQTCKRIIGIQASQIFGMDGLFVDVRVVGHVGRLLRFGVVKTLIR
uniref:Uncharacterized protein n=1 Tax=Cacopsylla melanoneura TaxID=428564 RepID=A0A8D9ETU6_9HEMI